MHDTRIFAKMLESHSKKKETAITILHGNDHTMIFGRTALLADQISELTDKAPPVKVDDQSTE